MRVAKHLQPRGMLSRLAAEARRMAGLAYCPYSRFPVGAALEGGTGRIYGGCNVENASYGLTVCAERVALFRAITEGESEFRTMVVYTPTEDFTYPCGACRQVIAEFAPDLKVVLINRRNAKRSCRLSQLLPSPFRP